MPMAVEENITDNSHSRPVCPQCGGKQTKPIVYGFVDVGEYLELGTSVPDFELGGLEPHNENWCCVRCRHRWVGL